MRLIKNKNTHIELIVRQLLFAAGYRYRLHAKQLPGRPDIIFPRRKIAIFVHGCFWHGHIGCKIAHIPKSRSDYWREKFDQNIRRDAHNIEALASFGWQSVVVWECETSRPTLLIRRLISALGPTKYTSMAPQMIIGKLPPADFDRTAA